MCIESLRSFETSRVVCAMHGSKKSLMKCRVAMAAKHMGGVIKSTSTRALAASKMPTAV